MHVRRGTVDAQPRGAAASHMRLGQVLHEFRDPLLRSPLCRWSLIASAAFLAVAWGVTLATPRIPGSAAVVVHYTTTFGIDALGAWSDLLRLPILGTVVFLLNAAIARGIAGIHAHPVGPDGAPMEAAPPAAPLMPTPSVTALTAATAFLEATIALAAILLWRVNTHT